MRETVHRGTLQFPFQHYEITHSDNRLIITAHWHEEIEVLYIIEGELTLIINGEQITLVQGDIYFINSGDMHHMLRNSAKLHYFAYVFPLDSLAFSSEDYSQSFFINPLIKRELLFPQLITSSSPCHTQLKSYIQDLIQLDINRLFGYQLQTKALLLMIIHLLYSEKLLQTSIQLQENSTIRDIVTYLNESYHNSISLNIVSKKIGMSPSYFCRFFKKNFGKTFVEYLNYLRIEKSCLLLKSTTRPILDISLEVGFQNISYFNKQFKSIMGCTPNYYRNKSDAESFILH